MKQIPLTQGKFALVDDEDYDWLMTWKWYAHKQGKTFYAATNMPYSEGGGMILMHRLLMMYPKDMHVDHINHDGLDNRKSNLRDCTNRQNQSNLRKPGVSQYTGVYWHKHANKWRSQIQINSKLKHLGYFPRDHEYDAHLAYLAAVSRTGPG